MALPQIFTSFLDKNGDTLQQLALLAYLKHGDEAKPYLEAITAAQVCTSLYRTISKEDQIEAARTEVILNVSKYVKEHPRARPVDIQNKVEDEVANFKKKLQSM